VKLFLAAGLLLDMADEVARKKGALGMNSGQRFS